jgi:hypothetical protein
MIRPFLLHITARNVVPAQAGTHNHRRPILYRVSLQRARYHPSVAMGPGSRFAWPGRQSFFVPQPYAAASFFGGKRP